MDENSIPYGVNAYLDAIFPRKSNESNTRPDSPAQTEIDVSAMASEIASEVASDVVSRIAFRLVDGAVQVSSGDGRWVELFTAQDLRGSPGSAGAPGTPGTDAEEVELMLSDDWIKWRRGAEAWANLLPLSAIRGPRGLQGEAGEAGPPGKAGNDGASGTNGTNGKDGKDGTNATPNTLLGSIQVAENASVIAIALGQRERTTALAGAVAGERYLCFVRSHRLNGGGSVTGKPAGYSILDCSSNANGQVTVSLIAPLLSIGQGYALACDIVKLGVT